MSATIDTSFKPLGNKALLQRPDARLAKPPGGDDQWTAIHKAIEEQLGLLEAEIRAVLNEVIAVAGRTQGEHFSICSYRTFSIPNSNVDRVVAGITMQRTNQGTIIEADISGESTGDIISTTPVRTVANEGTAVLEAALNSAQVLSQSSRQIVAALKDSSRRTA